MNHSLIACCLCLPALAFAQFRDKVDALSLDGIVLNPGVGINTVAPLLDPARMSWHHSVEMGYASGSSGALGSGLYLSGLDYRLSRTMDLNLTLGVHSLFHNSVLPGATGEQFVGGAEFKWRPSEHFQLRIAASRGLAPSPWYGNSAWSRWDDSPYQP